MFVRLVHCVCTRSVPGVIGFRPTYPFARLGRWSSNCVFRPVHCAPGACQERSWRNWQLLAVVHTRIVFRDGSVPLWRLSCAHTGCYTRQRCSCCPPVLVWRGSRCGHKVCGLFSGQLKTGRFVDVGASMAPAVALTLSSTTRSSPAHVPGPAQAPYLPAGWPWCSVYAESVESS